MSTTRQKASIGIGGFLAALLIALAANAANQQPPPKPPTVTTTTTRPATTTTTTTTAATTTTSSPLPPTEGVADPIRFGDPSASWNQPVGRYGRAPTLQHYVDRLWNHGGGTAPPGTINVAFSDWSVPIYPASSATTTARLYHAGWAENLYSFGTAGLGAKVPWNPAWRPGGGTDNILIVTDGDRAWEIGGVGQLMTSCITGRNILKAIEVNDPNSVQVCTAGAQSYNNLRTVADGTTIDGRGSGVNKAVFLTRADEVKRGAINHTLEFTIKGTMFGAPACTPLRGPNVPGFGTECGGYVAPATKLERTNPDTGCGAQATTVAERSKTIPEGMRFALDITDAEIERWLDTRQYNGPIRNTARIFAVALRDYGWVIAETGCWGMHIETDGVLGTAAQTWAELGIPNDGSAYPKGDLLAGLFTPERIYVVEPPA